MPIIQLQRRARELGRIRIGQKGDKGQPQKLDRFRITSPSEAIVSKVAELYGGTCRPWTPQGGAPQFEVITDARRIPIMVPPQPVSQWLETWTGGGCVHRCDGVTNVLTAEPCDPEDPNHINAKPTTRLNVVLRDVEGIGVFRLESHGWNAAIELPDVAAFLERAGGYVDGWLALEERVSKSDGQTRRFVVPTIEVDVTPAELMAGRGSVGVPVVEGPVERPALTTGTPSTAPVGDVQRSEVVLVNLIQQAASMDVLTDLMRQAKDAGYVTSDDSPAWVAGLARRDSLNAAASVAAAVQTAFGPTDPEPDPEAVWQQILSVSGALGWSLPELKDDYAKTNGGVDADTASGAELAVYLEALKAREPVPA